MKKTILLFISLCIALMANAQTTLNSTASEIFKYKEKNGFIVVELAVNGTSADFLLDLSGQSRILAEYAEKLGLKNRTPLTGVSAHAGMEYLAEESATIVTLSFGNNVSANGLSVLIINEKNNELKSLGVAGAINASVFRNCVLTINAQRKEITTSIPSRPSYMSLKNRADMTILPLFAVKLPFLIDGKATELIFDTSMKALIALSEGNKNVSNLKFVNATIQKPKISNETKKNQPVAGLGLLQHGILSIDYPHSKVYFQTYEETKITEEPKQALALIEDGKLNPIGRAEFLEYIFDYRKGTDFILKGDKPVVIDFWASWCGPCMKLLPEMEKLAKKYEGKIIFYKINADKEKELCSRFNIQALPTLFFIPKGGVPIVEVGALPARYVEIIETKLLK